MTSVDQVAWTLLRKLNRKSREVEILANHERKAVSEALRLAALNTMICQRFKTSTSEDEPLVFGGLSYGSEIAGVKEREVVEITHLLLENLEISELDCWSASRSTDEFIELLSQIHSLASYALPNGQDERIPRRTLGAYYTPRNIVDYIVENTVQPRLREILAEVDEGLPLLNILDPACGPGAFLVSSAKTLLREYRQLVKTNASTVIESAEIPNIIRMSLHGIDVDAGALEIARVSVELALGSNYDILLDQSIGCSLKQGNSLVSLNGMNGSRSHARFFNDPASRIPFEWQKEFSNVLLNNLLGFDCVIMNPPYQRLKPNLAEFKKQRLLNGDERIHLDNYESHKSQIAEDVRYFRDSGEFNLGNRYTIDTYRLFIERAIQVVNETGRIGFIVPSTLLGDLSAQKLRAHLLLENRVEKVREFSEGSGLFPGVTQSVCVMLLQKGGRTLSVNAAFGLNDIEDAKNDVGYNIATRNISQLTGNAMVIPRVPRAGWSILRQMHRKPQLGSLDWVSNKRGELDLTHHKEFIKKRAGTTRLVRGSHITRFSLVNPPSKNVESVSLRLFLKSLKGSQRVLDVSQRRIACQQVSNRLQHWRLKFALIPSGTVLANSCNYIATSEKTKESNLYYLLGLLNSQLLNWRFEVSNTNNHVSNHELSRLPIPDPNSMTKGEQADMLAISKMAYDRSKNDAENEHEIEARVFSLFGLSKTAAKRVMEYRGMSKPEINMVLKEL